MLNMCTTQQNSHKRWWRICESRTLREPISTNPFSYPNESNCMPRYFRIKAFRVRDEGGTSTLNRLRSVGDSPSTLSFPTHWFLAPGLAKVFGVFSFTQNLRNAAGMDKFFLKKFRRTTHGGHGSITCRKGGVFYMTDKWTAALPLNN